jgi:hypothetical protein
MQVVEARPLIAPLRHLTNLAPSVDYDVPPGALYSDSDVPSYDKPGYQDKPKQRLSKGAVTGIIVAAVIASCLGCIIPVTLCMCGFCPCTEMHENRTVNYDRPAGFHEGTEGTDDERLPMYPGYYVPQSYEQGDTFVLETGTRGAAHASATEKVSGSLHMDVALKTAPKTPPAQDGDGVELANIQPNGAVEEGGTPAGEGELSRVNGA